jgi:hypothetical protein
VIQAGTRERPAKSVKNEEDGEAEDGDKRRPAAAISERKGHELRVPKKKRALGSDTMLGRCNLYYLGAKGHNI